MFFRLDDVLQNRTPIPARHRPAIRPSSVSGLFAKKTPLAGTTPDSASPEKNGPSTETRLYDRVTRETTAVIDVRPICQLPGANGRPLGSSESPRENAVGCRRAPFEYGVSIVWSDSWFWICAGNDRRRERG